MTELTIIQLRALLARATPGPWETDTEYNEDGAYGSGPNHGTGYQDFLIGTTIDGKWATLLTTENSTAKLIDEDYDEDYHRAWDSAGEANAELVAAAVNALPGLLDRLDPIDIPERSREIADKAVPKYRDGSGNYSCTGVYAKRWQAAWDGACIALGGDPADYRS